MTVTERNTRSFRFQVDPSLYNERVLFKCLYWFTGTHEVVVTRTPDGLAFDIAIKPRTGEFTVEQLVALERRICQDLIDFKTRDIVAQETKVVRELLIAKAFAHSDEFDSAPPGSLDDPLGFDLGEYSGNDQPRIQGS